jgi:nucleoside-diphosphate-sugar epimerase
MGDRVLVTGATGAVGPRMVRALVEAGYSVRTLSLDPPQYPALPSNVETLIGDITDEARVRAAVQEVDAIVHLAALLHIVDPPLLLSSKYEQINIGGTATVTKAALRAGTKRLVFFSTIAVYGDSAGGVLTEESPTRPDTIYAQTKLAAERIVLESERADGRPLGTVLRLSAVYGARVKGNYRRLVLSLANGRFIPIGAGRNRRTLVYDKDVARAAVLAVRHPAAAGRVYNVSDGQFYTMREIIQTICVALARTPPRFVLPARPTRLGLGFLEDAARMAGCKSPIGRATIDKYIEDIAVSSQRIQTELGFMPQFDLARGWQEAVNEMRQAGDLARSHA